MRKGVVVIVALMLGVSQIPKWIEPDKNTFQILDQRQSHFGDIKVVQISRYKCLYVNGSGQTCVDEQGETDGFFQRFLRDEMEEFGLESGDRVLLLGLGGGGVLGLLPRDVMIDVVELDHEMIDVAKKHFGVTETKRVRIVEDDARHFLATTETDSYDLVLENIALGNAVPSYILSREAFLEMKRVVKADGVVLVHVGTHEIDGDNRFNEAVYSSLSGIFRYELAMSSQPEETANLVFYLSDEVLGEVLGGERYKANLEVSGELVVSDDYNPLDSWYLSNAISQRENIKPLGNDIFYVR